MAGYYDTDPATPDVPYLVHEGTCARLERTIKRLWILCIIMFLALVVSNAGWIWYESQFVDETMTTEVTQDRGINTFTGNNIVGGDLIGSNGESDR